MIARLKEVNAVFADKVNNAVFLGQTAGPYVRCKVFQGLGFADAGKGITNDGLNDVQGAQGNPTVRFHPIAQVFPEFDLENSFPSGLLFPDVFMSFFQGRFPV